jgi:hypothetical protein
MSRRFLLALVGALLLGVCASSVDAQTFSVKGVLRDPLGKTVEDGHYKLTFRLYDAVAGGTELWSEVQASMPTQHGVFSAQLGTVTSLADVAFDQVMWLGISVEDNPELAPRIQIGTTPYSISLLGVGNVVPSSGGVGFGTLTPQSALDVEGGAAIGAAYSGDVAAPANGLIVEGSVGIGTVAPSEPLEVNGNAKVTGALIFGDGTSLSSAELGGSASALTNPSTTPITADSDDNGSGQIEFKTGTSTDVVISNGGRMGIGRTSPTHALHVGVDLPGRPQVMSLDNAQNATGDGASLIFATNNGSWGTGGIGSVITSAGATLTADVRISTISNGSWVNDVLTVGSSGSVGINATNPNAQVSARLRVGGGGHVVVDNNYGLFSVNGAGNGYGAGLDTEPDDNMVFYAGGATQMRLASDKLEILGGNDLQLNTGDIRVTNGRLGILTTTTYPLSVSNKPGDGSVVAYFQAGNANLAGGSGRPNADIMLQAENDGGWGHGLKLRNHAQSTSSSNDIGRFQVLTSTDNYSAPVLDVDQAGKVTADRFSGKIASSGYASRSTNTNYTDASDGFVTGWCDEVHGPDAARAEGYVAGNLVALSQVEDEGGHVTTHAFISFLAPAGVTWQVKCADHNNGGAARFLPLGE